MSSSCSLPTGCYCQQTELLSDLDPSHEDRVQSEPGGEPPLQNDKTAAGLSSPSPQSPHLGRLYQTMERYEKAERMHLKAIKIKENLLGAEDYEVARSVGHLDSLYNSIF